MGVAVKTVVKVGVLVAEGVLVSEKVIELVGVSVSVGTWAETPRGTNRKNIPI